MIPTNLLSRVDELKTEIEKIRPIKPEQERRIIEKFRLDWNYHSNAIEGNQLTLGETRVLLLEGLTAHGKPLKDSLDIKGHNEVLTHLEDFIRRNVTLDEATLREFHKILLHEPYQVEARTPDGQVTKKWVKLGEYKSEPNFALGPTGEQRPFVLPQDTPAKMHNLMQWFKTEVIQKSLHPVIFAAEFHHRFVRIHPFDDGNGRMARILMNLILMQNGYQPVIIKTNRKPQYIAALIKADVGELIDFFSLIAEEEINSEELFLKGARGEDISEYDDVDKQIAMLKRELGDIPPPAELAPEIIAALFAQSIKPLFLHLYKKMSQFNDFYKATQVSISVVQLHSPHAGPRIPVPSSYPVSDINSTIQDIEKNIEGAILQQIALQWIWNGFKRAGINVFNDYVQITLNFQQYTFSITVNHQANQLYAKTIAYPNGIDEQQVSDAVKALAESCLKFIRQKTAGKKSK